METKTPQVPQQDGGETSMNPIQLMQYVAGKMIKNIESTGMKKQPDPDDTYVEWVKFPPEGGVLTKLYGFKEPFRGFPLIEFVQGLDGTKKLAKHLFKDVMSVVKNMNKIKLVLLFFIAGSSLNRLLNSSVNAIYDCLKKYELHTNMYSQPVREIYRAFDKVSETEDETSKSWLKKFQLIICILLEFDNAYRFRAQDILAERNVIMLASDPLKEIERLFNLITKREFGPAFTKFKDYGMIKKAVLLYLRFNKNALRIVQKLLLEISNNEIWLSQEDICFCEDRIDYVFGFMEHPGWYSQKQMEKTIKYALSDDKETKKMQNRVEEILKAVRPPVEEVKS